MKPIEPSTTRASFPRRDASVRREGRRFIAVPSFEPIEIGEEAQRTSERIDEPLSVRTEISS